MSGLQCVCMRVCGYVCDDVICTLRLDRQLLSSGSGHHDDCALEGNLFSAWQERHSLRYLSHCVRYRNQACLACPVRPSVTITLQLSPGLCALGHTTENVLKCCATENKNERFLLESGSPCFSLFSYVWCLMHTTLTVQIRFLVTVFP